ncbi:MAG: GGDEF domain-containing protein [Gemmatimonadota bacterium]
MPFTQASFPWWSVLGPIAALATGVAGYILGRRRPPRGVSSSTFSPSERVIPDPAIRWLGGAHNALAVWAFEGSTLDSVAIARHVNSAVLRPDDVESMEQRLAASLSTEDEGVQRMEQGTLIYVSRSAALAGMLLRPGPSVATDLALDDLRELANALMYHHALLPTRESKSPVESLAALGTGLAVQLERLAGAEVIVVANLHGGPQVIANSPTADKRLLQKPADPDSPAGKVSRGEDDSIFTGLDPLGTSITDRRRSKAAQVEPIGPAQNRQGAVILWPASGREISGQALGDVTEAIRSIESTLAAARMMHELLQSAMTDALTGLKNRRGLDVELTKTGSEFGALIYTDLDKFKGLNDSLGHPAGDAALSHFANILRDHVRSTDTAARIGGEEFAVWLPGATIERGVEIAERIRLSLGYRPWIWKNHQWPLTASFGVAGCPETSRSRQNLPAQADAALYQAKNGGRNKVATAGKSGDWTL